MDRVIDERQKQQAYPFQTPVTWVIGDMQRYYPSNFKVLVIRAVTPGFQGNLKSQLIFFKRIAGK